MQKLQIFANDFAKEYPLLAMITNAIANAQCERALKLCSDLEKHPHMF